jgi:hypothetical protein
MTNSPCISVRRVHRLGALVLVVLGTHAHALVLCATRNGAVVADERCRKREVQLDARDLGVIGPAGPSGPAGPAGPTGAPVEQPFRLVDANGATVCTPLAENGRVVQCVLEPEPQSAPVQLVLSRDGSDPERPQVYYGAPGCEGSPFTSEPTSPIARGAVLGTRLFVPNGTRVPLGALSSEQVRDECGGGTRTPHGTCCTTYNQSLEILAAPARQIDLSTLGLTAPLHGEEP